MTWTEPLQRHAASSHRSPDLGVVVDAFDMPIKHLNQIHSLELKTEVDHSIRRLRLFLGAWRLFSSIRFWKGNRYS